MVSDVEYYCAYYNNVYTILIYILPRCRFVLIVCSYFKSFFLILAADGWITTKFTQANRGLAGPIQSFGQQVGGVLGFVLFIKLEVT